MIIISLLGMVSNMLKEKYKAIQVRVPLKITFKLTNISTKNNYPNIQANNINNNQ